MELFPGRLFYFLKRRDPNPSPSNHSYAKIKSEELDLPIAPSSLINGVVPVG
jgi:hypothetical protein